MSFLDGCFVFFFSSFVPICLNESYVLYFGQSRKYPTKYGITFNQFKFHDDFFYFYLTSTCNWLKMIFIGKFVSFFLSIRLRPTISINYICSTKHNMEPRLCFIALHDKFSCQFQFSTYSLVKSILIVVTLLISFPLFLENDNSLLEKLSMACFLFTSVSVLFRLSFINILSLHISFSPFVWVVLCLKILSIFKWTLII